MKEITRIAIQRGKKKYVFFDSALESLPDAHVMIASIWLSIKKKEIMLPLSLNKMSAVIRK